MYNLAFDSLDDLQCEDVYDEVEYDGCDTDSWYDEQYELDTDYI